MTTVVYTVYALTVVTLDVVVIILRLTDSFLFGILTW